MFVIVFELLLLDNKHTEKNGMINVNSFLL